MSNAWQLALGRNIPLTVFAPPAEINLTATTFLRIDGGLNGQVLTTNGAGVLSWGPGGGGGGPGGPIITDNASIVGDGTAATPLRVDVIDCGAYTVFSSNRITRDVPDRPSLTHHDEQRTRSAGTGRVQRRDWRGDQTVAWRRRRW